MIAFCDISALEHAYTLKILLWVLFLTLNKILKELYKISKNLGIKSESSQSEFKNLRLETYLKRFILEFENMLNFCKEFLDEDDCLLIVFNNDYFWN